jgi:hypothetical protein
MRSEAEVREVFRLHALGLSQAEIARRVNCSRATVRSWVSGDLGELTSRHRVVCDQRCRAGVLDEFAYASLLGQYLGDGCISAMRRSFRLRITCCGAYPGIMAETAAAIRRVYPSGAVGYVPRVGCTEIASYWKHWPCLVPHGEGGIKHERRIELDPWQAEIALDRQPKPFLRGLIHSDGWRGINRVRGANGSRYEYPRYQFSNRSTDIRELFCQACDRVGAEWRQMNRWNISVAKRGSVALLDDFIGPKS